MRFSFRVAGQDHVGHSGQRLINDWTFANFDSVGQLWAL
jgi:hypothetical protein